MTTSQHSPTLDHAGLTCANLDTSLAFYHDLLGMPLLDRGSGIGRAAGIAGARVAFAMLDAGRGRMIELLEYLEPRTESVALPVSTAGGVHVALAVEDLDHLLVRLAGAGVRPLTSGPVTISDHGLRRWRGARLVYVLDPDRHVIELVQFAPGTGPARS